MSVAYLDSFSSNLWFVQGSVFLSGFYSFLQSMVLWLLREPMLLSCFFQIKSNQIYLRQKKEHNATQNKMLSYRRETALQGAL